MDSTAPGLEEGMFVANLHLVRAEVHLVSGRAAEAEADLREARRHLRTSAAAQYQLERGRLRTVLSDAVWAAYRRCQQLGGTADSNGNGHPLK